MKKVVTRIAPSPTGQMHIGTVRTALFNYLFARKHGGTYFVRIEDTDRERNKEEWVDAIWNDFSWCGLEPDAKYRTSERLDRHKELLRNLVESGKAYISKEPKKDDPTQSVEVVRLRNPGTSVSFEDLIRGTVTFDTTELGDFVIARAIDDPLYHFAVVVDDGDAEVTHILRAEEHISNTPRQILIQEALGLPRPVYGHLPLILAPDRSKLSKRKHGASVDKYRDEGILPSALVNYLALLGWNPGTEQEMFSMDELIEAFDISHVHKAGAVFDLEKLRWFNREYLLKIPETDFATEAQRRLSEGLQGRGLQENQVISQKLTPLIRERITVWGDVEKMISEGEFDFFFADPTLDPARIPERKSNAQDARKHLEHIRDTLQNLSDWSQDSIKNALWEYAGEHGRGAVLWPFRYALTGRDRSPDPFVVASMIGKESTVLRVSEALTKLIV